MNAERLNAIALALRHELDSKNIVTQLENLANASQQLGQNPGNTSLQSNFANARTSFLSAVTDAPSDSFTPAWRQVLVELNGEDLFGKKLRERVEQIFAENPSTLIVAHQGLTEILGKLRTFRESLTRLTDAFKEFRVGAEILAPGEAEIALLIPRDAVDNELSVFTDELKRITFILDTFSEVSTGQIENLKIRTVSSSNLMVFLEAGLKFAGMFAKVIDRIVGAYKKILDIKKVEREMQRLEIPQEISDRTKEHANNLMKKEIESFTVEIMEQTVITDTGRKHEMRIKVELSLNEIANKIDRGFNFEVRIEPPKTPPKEQAEAEAIQSIQSASANMQYIRLEGPPILALPENVEPATDGPTKPGGGTSKTRRSRAKVKPPPEKSGS